MVNRVGVLALQGNYNQHKRMLDVLGIKNILVQYPRELENCDLLIIPGGESTAMSKQIERNNFRHPILNFAKTNSVFGTCAGMILLSSSEKVTNLKPLSIMDFKVDRNAFGRQVDSFSGNLCLEFDFAKFNIGWRKLFLSICLEIAVDSPPGIIRKSQFSNSRGY